ncbi:uncharacterized protein TNCV_2312231 [Trichonephila clavipes]|nr:uncharacterized protein TNCV_2312231 [Trichonephila clavipes]
MWSMVAQRLTQITSPAATPDQLWQRVEAAWSAVPQEYAVVLAPSSRRVIMPPKVGAPYTLRDVPEYRCTIYAGFYGVAVLGFWTVRTVLNPISGQDFDAGHDERGVLHSARWHDGDWMFDGIRKAWLRCFVWMENFQSLLTWLRA